jgi:hypothetical protein
MNKAGAAKRWDEPLLGEAALKAAQRQRRVGNILG